MNDVFIVGTGGLAKEVAVLLNKLNRHGIIGSFSGYISESDDLVGASLPYGRIVASDSSFNYSKGDTSIVIASGIPKIKKRIIAKYSTLLGVDFPNIIDPTASFDLDFVNLGKGNIITNDVFISCNVEIGDFCLINWKSTVGHDVSIGNNCVINPHSHISGGVSILDNVLIGAGASLLENVNLGPLSTVGAGAVVTKHVSSGATVVGVPAKEIIRK